MSGRQYFALLLATEAEEADHHHMRRRNYIKRRRLFLNSTISDTHFIQRYRLTKSAFKYLCEVLREHSDLKSSQRVSLETKVLSALLFFANGDYQRVIGIANYLSQEAISRYVQEVTDALTHPNVVRQFIKFPSTEIARQHLKQSFFNLYGIPGVVGCVDGSHFRIVKPHIDEEHIYYCRKHYHSLNVQIVADHNGRILSVNPKFGGASHDAFVWENSQINTYMQNLHQNGEPVWLLGDSGYPQRPWLMTPYNNPPPGSAEETYNRLHSKARVIVENTFGRLKNRWRCLCKDRVLHYKPLKCAQIVTACCVLHNIALDLRVPVPQDHAIVNQEVNQMEVPWQAEQDHSLLTLGRLLRDQVARRLHGPVP